jgi:hypothetical protein
MDYNAHISTNCLFSSLVDEKWSSGRKQHAFRGRQRTQFKAAEDVERIGIRESRQLPHNSDLMEVL